MVRTIPASWTASAAHQPHPHVLERLYPVVSIVLLVDAGASRDPPEKQAPMCTLHSFPHNIDHCLTTARSEFEGIFEKAPAEADAYLASPDK